MKRRIVLLGPPASGKGTQAELIREKYGIETPSVGAILRELQVAKTDLGMRAAKYTNAGLLVPDEIIIEVVQSWLEKHDGAFVFDGFPRTTGQAEALEILLAKRGTPLDLAFSFEVDFATIQDRVCRRMVCGQCGSIVSVGLHVTSALSLCPRCGGTLERRGDDTLETLMRRMQEYREKSEPLVSYYEARGILRRIPGEAMPESVFASVSAELETD